MEVAWPKRCVGCERLGVLFCEDCQAAAPVIESEQACPRCGAPYGALICTECYGTDGPLELSFDAAVCAYQFSGASARMIVVYKDQHEQRLAAICAEQLAKALPSEWINGTDLLTFVPTDKERARERGFDHMQLIARKLGEFTRLEARALLSKRGGVDQRILNREQRLNNLSQAIACSDPVSAKGRSILLIDDVMTTTATMEAASVALKAAGAREVRAAALCRVY